MLSRSFLRALPLLGWLFVADAPAVAAQAPVFTPGACAFEITAEVGAHRCGTVNVPADTERGTGRIDIGVVVLEARDTGNAADPLLFLHGGPGSGVIRSPKRWFNEPLRRNHDLILVDQRGSWGSGEFCADLNGKMADLTAADLTQAEHASRLANELRQCQRNAKALGIDMRHYRTSDIASDIEAVRRALAIPKWNVWAVSYGSAVGLAMAHHYPATMRSLLLDSVSPNDPSWRYRAGANYNFALDRFMAQCRAQPSCASAHPDLADRYTAAIATLQAKPLALPVPPGGRFAAFTLNAQDFVMAVHRALYDPATMAKLPAMIEAVARRDAAVLAELPQLTLDGLGTRAYGAHFAIDCQGRGMQPTKPPRRQDFPLSIQFKAACDALALPNRDPRTYWSAPSAVPTLILAGALDPITPPNVSRDALQQFSNAQLVEIPGQGHGVAATSECARQLIARFIDDPVSRQNVGCPAAL